ncbi:hypothetical protein ACWEN3_34820 [Streptomyces sp. NPDC004561]
MIRRTLKSGLLATVAVLALLPTTAGAAAAATTAQHPVPAVAAQQYTYRTHHVRHHVHYRSHHARRMLHAHRGLRFTPQGTVYLLGPQGMAYRITVSEAPYHRTLPLTGRVATHRLRLNVRSGPGTGYRVVGHRSTHRLMTLTCKTYGSGVRGNHVWYRLPRHRGYVSAHYVRTSRAVPWC